MSSCTLYLAIFYYLFYFCICRICHNFKRYILLRNAVSFKQIGNFIKILTYLEINHLQNKYACEVKMTE